MDDPAKKVIVIEVAKRESERTYAIKMSYEIWDGFKSAIEKWYNDHGIEVKWKFYDV